MCGKICLFTDFFVRRHVRSHNIGYKAYKKFYLNQGDQKPAGTEPEEGLDSSFEVPTETAFVTELMEEPTETTHLTELIEVPTETTHVTELIEVPSETTHVTELLESETPKLDDGGAISEEEMNSRRQESQKTECVAVNAKGNSNLISPDICQILCEPVISTDDHMISHQMQRSSSPIDRYQQNCSQELAADSDFETGNLRPCSPAPVEQLDSDASVGNADRDDAATVLTGSLKENCQFSCGICRKPVTSIRDHVKKRHLLTFKEYCFSFPDVTCKQKTFTGPPESVLSNQIVKKKRLTPKERAVYNKENLMFKDSEAFETDVKDLSGHQSVQLQHAKVCLKKSLSPHSFSDVSRENNPHSWDNKEVSGITSTGTLEDPVTSDTPQKASAATQNEDNKITLTTNTKYSDDLCRQNDFQGLGESDAEEFGNSRPDSPDAVGQLDVSDVAENGDDVSWSTHNQSTYFKENFPFTDHVSPLPIRQLERPHVSGVMKNEEDTVILSDNVDEKCLVICGICHKIVDNLQRHAKLCHKMSQKKYRELYPTVQYERKTHHR